MAIKTKRCSYCDKEFTKEDIEKNDILIFASAHNKIDDEPIRICSNCVKSCEQIYTKHYQKIQNKKRKESIDLNSITPVKIKQHLDEWVIEQERAKTDISTEIYNHFKRLKRLEENPDANKELRVEKSNIILIGPTGVGKTELVRSLSAYLDLPYVIEDSTSFTSAGYNLFL